MIQKKGLFAIILMVLMSAALAGASSLSASHTGPSQVPAGSVGTYSLKLVNSGIEEAWVTISPDPFSSLPDSKFDRVLPELGQVRVPASGEKIINVSIKLKKDVTIGERYSTFLTIKSVKDSSINFDHHFIMRVVEPEEILTFTAILPENVKPGQKATVQTNFKNNLNAQVNNIELYISSELFNEQRIMNLFPFQEKIEDISFEIPSDAKAGSYAISARAYYNKELIAKETGTFEISKTMEVKETKEKVESILVNTVSITKTNLGNHEVDESYDHSLSKIEKMFTVYEPSPTFSDSDGMHWKFTLDPNKSSTIKITTDYSPLVYIIGAIVIFLFFSYFFFRKSVTIKKNVYKLKQTSDGNSQLRIMLIIKNRTGRKIKKLSIVELLPSVIKPSARFGTLRPERVQKGSKGIKLTWEIQELGKGEERIISYEVKSKLSIIGRFILPRSLLIYRGLSGRMVHVHSNKLSLLTGLD